VPEYIEVDGRAVPRWLWEGLEQIQLTREEFFEHRSRGEYLDIPVPEGW
jgi:hypothetical protein